MLPESVDLNSITLALEDLEPDTGNEIVFEGKVNGVVVVTDQTVVSTGTSQPHVTAAGMDVTGYCYYQLEGGVRLYSPIDLKLTPSGS